MDTDRNLLFGVLALQADLIDADRFAEACSAWAARKQGALADLMVARGWITESDRVALDHLLQRKLDRHDGDARKSLAAVADDEVRRLLAALDDSEIQSTVIQLESRGGHVLLSTIIHTPETRERYTLTRLHAKGGLGQVWLAHDGDLGREVALKELRPERAGNPALWVRFLEEAKITGQLEHPGIVPVYELGRNPNDQKPFYTMRFVRGRTLSEAIASYHAKRQAGHVERLDLVALLNAFTGVCNAVAYAHSRGVVHRDLKGQNVVLGDFGEVIVLDWGLAKLIGQPEEPETLTPPVTLQPSDSRGETEPGRAMGTPAYMSPEQAEGRHDIVDRRSDVYSLGAILYEILTGRPPFSGGSTDEVLRKVREEPPTPPRQVVPDAPKPLEAVCLRAMAKRPDSRYASAKDLAQEIQRYLADEPVSAYREPISVRLDRWRRRHQALVSSAAVLLVTAVVVLAISNVWISREKARADDNYAWAHREQLKAQANFREAEHQRETAEANFRMAHDAVQRYLTTVSESQLLNVPGLQPLRRELLESAEEFFETFIEQGRDDPTVRLDQGRALMALAKITAEIDAKPRAVELYRRALAVFEHLARDEPDPLDHQRLRAAAQTNLAYLDLELGRLADAEDAFRDAEATLDQLVAHHPDDPRLQADLAKLLVNRGRLLQAQGRFDQAQETLEQALDHWQAVVAAYPDEPQLQGELAAAHNLLATIHHASHREDRAEQAYRQGLAVFDALVAKHPDHVQFQSDLASTHTALGMLLGAIGRTHEAEAAFDQAVRIRQKLARENPVVGAFQHALAQTVGHQGFLLAGIGQFPRAEQAYQQALELCEKLVRDDPSVPAYQNELAASHGALGLLYTQTQQLEKAEQAYREAIAIWEELSDAGANPSGGFVTIQENLAKAYGNLGFLALDQGRLDQAEQDHRKALAIWDALLQDQPDHAEYHSGLGWNHNQLGRLLKQRDRLDEAEEHWWKAREVYDALADRHPDVLEFALHFAAALGNLADAARDKGDFEDALDGYGRAIATLDDLLKKEPRRPETRQILGQLYQHRAEVLGHWERYAEALADWDRAIELAGIVYRDGLRLHRAVLLAYLGDHTRAADEAEDLARRATDANALYGLASVFALCAAAILQGDDAPEGHDEPGDPSRASPAERYAARAVALLEQARDLGAFQQPGALEYVEQDPNLNVLRARDDFQALMTQIGRAGKSEEEDGPGR